MPTTLTAPLAIGDKVYTISRRDATVTIQCPYCGESGEIEFIAKTDGALTKIKCPKCEGKGKLRAGKSRTVYDVKRREIVGIALQAGTTGYGKTTPVTYYFGGEAGGSCTEEGSVDSFKLGSPVLGVGSTYWLVKADAEAVAARLSAKEPLWEPS